MNVWAIDKDSPIKVLLVELVHRYGENTLAMINRENHFQAIEICPVGNPELSAYVYTFGQRRGCYGIDLKYPIVTHNIIGENEDQSLEHVLEIIDTHLF